MKVPLRWCPIGHRSPLVSPTPLRLFLNNASPTPRGPEKRRQSPQHLHAFRGGGAPAYLGLARDPIRPANRLTGWSRLATVTKLRNFRLRDRGVPAPTAGVQLVHVVYQTCYNNVIKLYNDVIWISRYKNEQYCYKYNAYCERCLRRIFYVNIWRIIVCRRVFIGLILISK